MSVSKGLCNLWMKKNLLITQNNIMFVPRKLSSSFMKSTFQLNSCMLRTVGPGPLCRFSSAQNSKYTQNCQRPCHVSVAVAVGLLVGWTVLELQQHTVSCVAEATETNECHDTKERTDQQCRVVSLEEAISESDQQLQRVKLETNSPGLIVAVTIDGKEVWTKGYGVTDIENLVDCTPASVMRIASISKPLTMVAIAQLWEQGKLDLDKPVQHYVPSWPEKVFKGQKATITSRHLVSMLGGIRHYDKLCRKEADKKKEKQQKKSDKKEDVKKENEPTARKSEFDHEEYYIKKHYSSVTAALELFKNDELCSFPGTEFLYSSHAWTLLSAVVEGAGGRKFTDVMRDLFRALGLENTYLDEDRPIIPHRSRYYVMDKQKQRLVNAPYVDNSYKWAGGGFLSTVHDLCHFGNALLYSYQWTPQTGRPAGFLRPDTVQMMWSPVPRARCSGDGLYAMGWCVVPPAIHAGYSRNQRMHVSHTGGAIGASSVLLILPRREMLNETIEKSIPRGVCVAIIVNQHDVGLRNAALTVAKLFDCAQQPLKAERS